MIFQNWTKWPRCGRSKIFSHIAIFRLPFTIRTNVTVDFKAYTIINK